MNEHSSLVIVLPGVGVDANAGSRRGEGPRYPRQSLPSDTISRWAGPR